MKCCHHAQSLEAETGDRPTDMRARQLHQAALGREGVSDPVTVNHAQAVDTTCMSSFQRVRERCYWVVHGSAFMKLRACRCPSPASSATLVHSPLVRRPVSVDSASAGESTCCLFVGEKPGPKSKGHHT